MEWAHTLTIVVSLGTFVIYVVNRSDEKFSKQDDKFQKQTERSDRLYEMFIDLLKENRNER